MFFNFNVRVIPTSQRPYNDLAAISDNLAVKSIISVLALQKLNS